VLSKQELMEAVWPNVHVGEDSLFQCIRELRTALGDDRRQMIKLASGGGYLLTAEVVAEPPAGPAQADVPRTVQAVEVEPPRTAEVAAVAAAPSRSGLRGWAMAAAAAGSVRSSWA
jgi:DNA-binding winged helix-turn-helix (wHTH) protein